MSRFRSTLNLSHKWSRSATLLATATLTATASTLYLYNNQTTFKNDSDKQFASKFPPLIESLPSPPTREELLSKLGTPLSNSDNSEENLTSKDAKSKFDLIIVGGGAVGSGAALDAQLRGLNVLLLEKNDFASGTSSKSTKMAHGGVRYLEKAIFQLSKAQLDLVIEALNERASILNNAPHLAQVLPITIPVYKYWQLPYFYAGCLMYDLFAGSQALRYSYIMTKSNTLDKHKQLDGEGLVGGLVYHDGLFNDSRMNVSLALTAEKHGATILNYMDVKQLLKDETSLKTKGVRVQDIETGSEYLIAADAVISATGPYSDLLLSMDKSSNGLPEPNILNNPRMVVPSGGVHVVLPEWYCAKDMGLLDANTSDGRVMFFLPWQGKVLAGTTDVPLSKIPENPVATELEINDILKELQHYVKFKVRREDVLSAWCGVRPLVRDPSLIPQDGEGLHVSSTQGLVRNHLIYHAPNGLITISGGKWTTYREMAEDVINQTINSTPEFKTKNLKNCVTRDFKLIGAENFDQTLQARLAQTYQLTDKLSSHLSSNYGDRAPIIISSFKSNQDNMLPLGLLSNSNKPSYKSFDHQFTIGELKYCLKYEHVRHPVDFLARRCRLAFLDSKAALNCIDDVVEIMADEFKWDQAKKDKVTLESKNFIQKMGITENLDPYGSL
ncbi:hypothetical protein CANARDRAFT_29183 [[Candida] arabinofermentans NRRL YB-2248]|uniref:Glycerol-3-phosphate dehydrogenase n=1 Tax=[Candida] arabinofermentans NRRL YB-2248 TaxID=983967 RepID=A0A1E4SXS6_9ASCO|nr:hypothetical protein CANARDRAFT_29183 [[Candida] arabinofermentans NRRL YB-2248]